MKLLSRAEILEALERLAGELSPEASSEIIVGGGAALVLLYGAREATKDVDALAISAEPGVILAAARRVAESMDLPEDWLNEGAKGYLHGLEPGEILFEAPSDGSGRRSTTAPCHEAERLAR